MWWKNKEFIFLINKIFVYFNNIWHKIHLWTFIHRISRSDSQRYDTFRLTKVVFIHIWIIMWWEFFHRSGSFSIRSSAWSCGISHFLDSNLTVAAGFSIFILFEFHSGKGGDDQFRLIFLGMSDRVSYLFSSTDSGLITALAL